MTRATAPPGRPSSSQQAEDAANLDATINVYDADNQIVASYLPWGCALGANSSKPASASGFCTTTQAKSTDPRRWRIDYTRTSPSVSNGDWVGAVTQAYQWNTLPAPTSSTTAFDYLPNGWIKQQRDRTYQDGTVNGAATTSQNVLNYIYDTAGDQIEEQSAPTVSSIQNGTTTTKAAPTRQVWRSYWQNGQLQQLDGYGAGVADHTYDYYWNPTGQMDEVAVGSFVNGVSSQAPATQACYDPAGRVQRVYQGDTDPVYGTFDFDTFYAYDADGNETERETNGSDPPSSSNPLCQTLPQGGLPLTYAGGQTTTLGYDSLDRQTSMAVASNSGSGVAPDPTEPARSYHDSYWPSGAVASETRSEAAANGGTGTATQSWYYNDDGTIASTTTNDGHGTQAYAYDTDGNLTQSENGTHLYNASDQEVQWTRGGTNTANPGGTVNYMYDGAGALMQEQTSIPTATATLLGLGVEQATQQTTTLFCSAKSAPTPTSGETPTQAAGSTTTPACQLDNGRPETVQTYETGSATILGIPQTVTPAETTQTYCYDAMGDLEREVEAPDDCVDQSPVPQTSSLFNFNVFGQQVSSTVPLPGSNANQTLSENTTYDPLGREIYQIQTLSQQASTINIWGYLGLSSDVITAGGTLPNGTAYENIYDYDNSGRPKGLYTSTGVNFYSYLLSSTGSVLGLEGSGGTIGPDDGYHYTPTGELELGSNEEGSSIQDQLGNQNPNTALTNEAQANQLLFDGYSYNQGSPPAGAAAGTPGTDSYTAPARDYLPGSYAWESPDTFEQGSANAALALSPRTQDLYAFNAGNPTSTVDGDGHRPNCATGECPFAASWAADPKDAKQAEQATKRYNSAPGVVANTIIAGAEANGESDGPSAWQWGSRIAHEVGTLHGSSAEQSAAARIAASLTSGFCSQKGSSCSPVDRVQDTIVFDNLVTNGRPEDAAMSMPGRDLEGGPRSHPSLLDIAAGINGIADALQGGLDPLDDSAEGALIDAADAGVDASRSALNDEISSQFTFEDQSGGLSGAVCGGQSFSPNTLVELADGRSIPISQLRTGDRVLATDPATGVTRSEPVQAVWVKKDQNLLNLTVHTRTGDAVIQTTQDHLFYDLTQHAWVQADNLEPGDQLYGARSGDVSVVSTDVVSGGAEMWDLTVASDHDFYVLTAGSAGVLVHNMNIEDGACGAAEMQANTNPFVGPVDRPVNVVTPGGDVFDLEPGESMTASPDSKWLQVRNSNGEPTGERLDNGHLSHTDPRAQGRHIHVPGVTNSDGTPWLPAK